MPLTPAQLQTFKTHLAANTNTVSINGTPTAINAVPHTTDNAFAVAAWYNLVASPDFWVWRTSVTKAEFVQGTSVDGTTFNWTGAGFITRSQGERDAWRELFNGTESCNPSLPNVRQAFQDIFSGGTAPAPANRTHLAAVGRRKATNAEQVFATGTGSTASPAVMGFEGAVQFQEVQDAWNLP